MKISHQKRIAKMIKEKRTLLGLTQLELSEKSNLSIRSIQRIEKGEVNPRGHSIKQLSICLDIPLQELTKASIHPIGRIHFFKLLLSIGIIILPNLLFAAFLAQSNRFPETNFELIISSFIILSLEFFILLWIWYPKSMFDYKAL